MPLNSDAQHDCSAPTQSTAYRGFASTAGRDAGPAAQRLRIDSLAALGMDRSPRGAEAVESDGVPLSLGDMLHERAATTKDLELLAAARRPPHRHPPRAPGSP